MKAIVSLSGGMDSATVLAKALSDGREVLAFSFYYGSKHNPYELAMASILAKRMQVLHQTIELTSAFKGVKSNLMHNGGAIPEGHYEAETMKQTVVPGRNLIFISHLVAHAVSNDCQEIWLGVHAGDHAIYPDCRPAFVEAMNEAVMEGTDGAVRLIAPFLDIDKAGILKVGQRLAVPYELTRTCYKDQNIACGKCGSCQERLAAFEAIGMTDPLDYESRTLMPK